MRPLAALTQRVFTRSLRDLDLLLAVGTPVAFLVIVTVGLQNVIDTGAVSYPQYVLPAVVVQSILLGTLTAADRAARDKGSGIDARLRTLPVPVTTPLLARLLYCLLRDSIAIAAAIAMAHVLGFRFSGGPGHTLAFIVIALSLTVGLSLGADSIGSLGWALNDASQLLLIPQLLLVVLSTGLAPVESFPGWVQPFVRNQPVSQLTETLRGLASGHVESANLAISVAWCVGMIVVFGAVALRLQTRRP